jgi:lysophospholipase
MLIETIRDKSNTLDLRFCRSKNSDSASRFLVMANGRSEWLEKYFGLAADLRLGQDTGFITFDHRGQGASGGARAWIDHYDTYASDMAMVVNKSTNGKPFNLICHSMGGLVGLVATIKGFIKPRCIVLSSPLIGMPNYPFPAATAYHISKLFTKCSMGFINSGGGKYWTDTFEKNLLTRSLERYNVIQNSPYPVPSPTFEWVKASYEATQFIANPENIAALNIPILVLCGTEEHVVDSAAIQRWVSTASRHSKSDVEFHWIQGGLHELLNESKPIYDQTLNLIRSWFDKQGYPV